MLEAPLGVGPSVGSQSPISKGEVSRGMAFEGELDPCTL